jgi:hypothetical protein
MKNTTRTKKKTERKKSINMTKMKKKTHLLSQRKDLNDFFLLAISLVLSLEKSSTRLPNTSCKPANTSHKPANMTQALVVSAGTCTDNNAVESP